MKKTILSTLFVFLGLSWAVAQVQVTGKVAAADDGKPISFATVMVKGTSTIAYTNDDGSYSVKVPGSESVLVFSFIGLKNQEVVVGTRSVIDVMMESDSNVLDESIVTAYGTFKKSAYAGSASVLKTEGLQDVPAMSFSQLLSGNAAGVSVNASSGQPGAPSDIRIRGVGSFNASRAPLYVVDGVPVNSGNAGPLSGNFVGIDFMSTLNTTDIENITVIKDAAAASLYGSRAANGVIIITTKSGKKGKPAFAFKTDFGFSDDAMPYREIMGGAERRETIWEGLYNEYVIKNKTEAEAIAYADSNIDKYAPIPWSGYADWNDVMFRRGFTQNYDASISGGGDGYRYYTSLNYMDQEGIARGTGIERITGRLNADYDVNKKLKIGVKSLFSRINQSVMREGSMYTSPHYATRYLVTPSDPVYNEDGTYNVHLIKQQHRNPKQALDYNSYREKITRVMNTVYGEYEFVENLKLKSTYSYDFYADNSSNWKDPKTSDGVQQKGIHEKTLRERGKWVWSNALSYNFVYKENHLFDALVAYDVESYARESLSATTSGYASAEKNVISNGAVIEGATGSVVDNKMSSIISRFNYSYASKYYAGVSYRYDGTSKLHKSNRWGSFWSVSGAWRISQEKFMKDISNVISDLRLRASYGVNGTQPSDNYGYQPLISVSGSYDSDPAMKYSQLENFGLTWESNYNLNLGLDVGLFNRVNLTVEAYRRTTKDLLMDFPISSTTGFTSILLNKGEVRNTGIEIEISSTNIQTKHFTWATSFNIGHNKNKILKLDGISTAIPSLPYIRQVGQAYNTFYVLEFAGINPENGNPLFYKNTINSDGSLNKEVTEKYSEAERIVYKSADPTVTGGVTNSFKYKWVDFNFLVGYSFGGYSYDGVASTLEDGGQNLDVNIPLYYRDRWKKPGDVAKYERYVANRSTAMKSITSSRRIYSTDFIRLRNLTFGITLPNTWAKYAGLSSVRLFFAGTNLLTWAKEDIYDPESVNVNGRQDFGQPPVRTLVFGVDIKF